MRPGDVSTPLVLWICAALCAHFLLGEGGEQVALWHDDSLALASLGEKVRDRVRTVEQTFDVATIEEQKQAPSPSEIAEPPKPVASAKPEPPKPVASAKPEPPKPPLPPKKIDIFPQPVASAKAEIPPAPMNDHRIAVRQHVQPNQEDNPQAHFLGDEANHVQQETVATQTVHDRDDPNPTPGATHAGPQGEVGNSDQTRIGDSESHPGQKDRGPGEHGTELEIQPNPIPTRPQAPTPVPGAAASATPPTEPDSRQAMAPGAQPPGEQPEPSSQSAVIIDANGNWIFNPVRPSGSPQDSAPTKGKKIASNAASTTWLGLGSKTEPGHVNLNLNQNTVVASVGLDQLTRERRADGERRRSEHRGSFVASNFERWRSAIENYVSTVKPGNQTALNTAKSPFATYLNGMHNRIHPIFADSFLGSLDSLPRQHPMNDPKMFATLEIVLTPNGHVVKMGVVKTSGVTAFDIAALDSVQRASPFDQAPSSIVSPDGRVYLHWEFHRLEEVACSNMNARPFLLNVHPSAPPVEPTPTPSGPSAPQERGTLPPVNLNESRQGLLEMPRPSHPA